ncbi:uncharacterized protein LOC111404718 [Olea europaea var. sylvestris]|uniref:uncharacterized protein LOC111404718 n=1 Tax=Olea europaea var. sylvestris TaxID=158386 RepID=UPI000C1D6F2D|nr:uncharacterized protein LOC111404718 [Olea europaea var. sylvestris]
MVVYFVLYTVSVVNAANVSAQVNNIPMLNGTNFKFWKEAVEIVVGCMDLDLVLRSDRPISTLENPNKGKIESVSGLYSESGSAKKFLEESEQYFAKNEKLEASNLLAKLVSIKYKGKGNIREYIMEMSHLASKLKSLKLELSDDLLVHLILISLPAYFGQFKVSYNTQKDKWSLNELISYSVQEEERQQRDKTESAHLASTSQNKKKKRAKDAVEGTSQQKKQKKQDKEFTCYFCKKSGHMKKECLKYAAWRVKNGMLLTLVCSEVNLASVPKDTWIACGADHQVIKKDFSLWAMAIKLRYMIDNMYILDIRIQRLVSDGILEPLDLTNFHVCVECIKGKRTNMRKLGAERATDVLELIHTDICGPFPTTSWNGQQYFITFINDYSRFGFLYLIHEKSQSLDVFKSFKAEVELQLGKKIKAIKSNRGGEYYGRYDGSGEQRPGPFAIFLNECGTVP